MLQLNELRQMTEGARRELHQVAEEARRLAEQQRQAEDDQAKVEAEYYHRFQELKADYIIAQIVDRAKREAQAGRNHAILMAVGYDDYDRPRGVRQGGMCEPHWLTGAARIVYQYCQDTGFKPTLEYWHDGVGVKSGFNIVIHW